MKRDSAIALAILCGLLVAQPFLHDGFGAAVSIAPIAAFAVVLLYLALRSKSP